MSLTEKNYEIHIANARELRAIYEFLREYGDNLNFEYEGTFNQRGDTVQIRPNAKLLETSSYRPLVIDKELPRVGRLKVLMNAIDWESSGDIVVTANDQGEFFFGYNKVETK